MKGSRFRIEICRWKTPQAQLKVAAFFSQYTDQYNEQSITRRLDSLPIQLSKRFTFKEASKLSKQLNVLGAETDIAPVKGLGHRSSSSNVNLRLIFLITLLVTTGWYALFGSHQEEVEKNSLISGFWGSQPDSSVDLELPEAAITRLMLFSAMQGSNYDKNIISGLEHSIHLGFQLGNSNLANSAIHVTHTATVTGKGRYLIDLTVTKGDDIRHYILPWSSSPSAFSDNLNLSSKLVARVRNDWPNDFVEVTYTTDSSLPSLWNTSENPYLDLSTLLSYYTTLDKLRVDYGNTSELFLAMSEALSLLAIQRSATSGEGYRHFMGQRSVALWLLAHSGSTTSDHDPYYAGLLLASLDYPGPATELLTLSDKANHPAAILVKAGINRDLTTLEATENNSVIGEAFHWLLLARAYGYHGFYEKENAILSNLVYYYPYFIPGLENAMEEGGLDTARQAYAYLYPISIDRLASLLDNLVDIRTSTVLAQFARLEFLYTDPLSTLFGSLASLAKSGATVENATPLWTDNWLKSLLKEDMLSTLRPSYALLIDRLALPKQTRQLLAHLGDIFPNHSIGMELNSQYVADSGSYEQQVAYISSIDLSKANAATLLQLLSGFEKYFSNTAVRLKAMKIFLRLKVLIPPSLNISEKVRYYAGELGYREYNRHQIRHVAELAPFDFKHRIWAADYLNDPSLMDGLDNKYENSPTFNNAMAKHEKRKGNEANTIKYWQAAQSLVPESITYYKRIAEYYASKSKYQKALDTLQQAELSTHFESLSGGFALGTMGDYLRKLNRDGDAYEYYQRAEKFGHSKGINDLAKAEERRGNLVVAEQLYKKDLKRYASTDEIVEYAAYLVRQKRWKEAVKLLKSDATLVDSAAYLKPIIAIFKKEGTPELAETLFHEILESAPSTGMNISLARAYAHAKEPNRAFKVYEQTIEDLSDFKNSQGHHYIGEYLKYAKAKSMGEPQRLFAKRMPVYRKKGAGYIQVIGIELLGDGLYATAFDAFKEVDDTSQYRANLNRIFMTISLLLSKPDDATLKVFKQKISTDYENVPIKLKYLLDDVSEQDFYATIKSVDALCEYHFLAGVKAGVINKKELARSHWLMALETKATRNIEYSLSHDLLRLLQDNNL